MLQAFLSQEMMYSCALWGDEEGGVRGDLTHGPTPGDLEAAQQRKIHHVLRTARLKPGDRVLEFGTGWGALAIEVSIEYGLARCQANRRAPLRGCLCPECGAAIGRGLSEGHGLRFSRRL